MATREELQSSGGYVRRRRYFSEDFERKKVRELERNITTVHQLSREYEVSRTAIYKWLYTYSTMRKKGVRQVVESKRDTAKITQLRSQVQDLELMLGQKQFQVDFLAKMIELAEQEYGVDINKKFSSKRSAGSGSTGKSTGKG